MKDNIDASKRSFLKKAAYSAPVIVGLGSLTTASAKFKMGHSCWSMKDDWFKNREDHLRDKITNLDPSRKNYERKLNKLNFKLGRVENRHTYFDARKGITHEE